MKDVTKHDWHHRVDQAVMEIMAALDDSITFATIARSVASSPYHFHRKFRELTGESVHQCIRRLRLERAAYLIRHAESPITDISLDSGYETLEAFSKAFKKAFTISPSDVRKLESWNGLLYSRAGIHYGSDKEHHWFYVAGEGDDVQTKIIHLPKKRLIGLEHVGDPWGLPETWRQFLKAVRDQGLQTHLRGAMTAFFESPAPVLSEERRQFAAGIVDEGFENTSSLQELTAPEGLYAVIVHFGSCEEIGSTWERWLKTWLPDSGWVIDYSRPALEWYQNEAELPELSLTFYCTPIKRAE